MALLNTSRLYVGALFAFLAVYLLSLAIEYTDSDLWYHLAGGSHLLETGNLFNPLDRSFLGEPRDFINYYWGFQTTAYATWLLAKEPGLIILKTGFFLMSAYFVMRTLLEGRDTKEARFLQLLVLAIIIGILCARGLALRPHLASYAMIPLFIYILAYREKLYFLLPALTVIWVNMHGVEYVVGALICGSYFLQRLINFDGNKPPLIWITLCLPAMMLNPNGVYVLLTPFAHDPDLHRFILELGQLEIHARLDLHEGITINTLVLILLFFVTMSGILVVGKFREHLAPLLIAAGGLILLVMAQRFIWEWALLSTPLIALGLRYWPGPKLSLPTTGVLYSLLFLLAMTNWPVMRNGIHHYPLNAESLPYGTTEFIRQLGLKGRYAIEPSYAGYVEFELHDVQIHLDMQFPPFTSMDIQEINVAMRSAGGLRTYVEKYSPDLIGVKKSASNFPVAEAARLGYAPVFFDKKVVLFLKQARFPDVAEKFQYHVVNPFNEAVLPAGNLNAGIGELERMLGVVSSDDIRLTLVGLLLELGQTNRAEVYLSELLETSPDDVATVYYQARYEHLSDNCPAAIEHYEFVIEHSAPSPDMHLQLAECYFLTRDLRAAFTHYSEGLNPYKDNNPNALTYFQFALAAVAAGEPEIAHRLLTMIQRFDPDSELSPQISKMLKDLDAE